MPTANFSGPSFEDHIFEEGVKTPCKTGLRQRLDSLARLASIRFIRRTDVLIRTQRLKPARRTGTQMWFRQKGWDPATDSPAQAKRNTTRVIMITPIQTGSESYQGEITLR